MRSRATATGGRLAVVLATVLVVGCTSVTPTTPPGPTASPLPTPASSLTPTPASSAPSATPSSSSGATPTPLGSAPPASPGATVEPELAAQIDAVTAQVPPVRDLQPTREVPYEFISREQFRDDLIDQAFEDTTPEQRAAEERALKRLGLLPADSDLTELLVELYGGQVAAYYRPDTGRFYIIQRDSPFGPIDKLTTAHEYTHALQDQHFDLEGSRIKDISEGDAILAQLAVVEGDATLTSQRWMLDNLTPAEQLQLLGESLGELDEQQLLDMPIILRRQLEFPYTEGFLFTSEGLYKNGGYEAVDQALQTPPASTEQILHSEKYFASEQPIEVTVDDLSAALGEGWSLTYEQTLGELNLQVFVGGGEEPPFNIPGFPAEWPFAEAAAGWGGDRLVMYEGPDDAWVIKWLIAWDSETDMNEFRDRLSDLLPTLPGVGSASHTTGENVSEIVIASDVELTNLVFNLAQ